MERLNTSILVSGADRFLGQIPTTFAGEPAVTALCHCVDCQKWTGAAYTSNVVVPRTNFKVTKGKPKDYDAKGASGKINKHWVRRSNDKH